eukprot:2426871-Pleurochrysis_carterae.AAC.1
MAAATRLVPRRVDKGNLVRRAESKRVANTHAKLTVHMIFLTSAHRWDIPDVINAFLNVAILDAA